MNLKFILLLRDHDHVYEVIGPIDNKTNTLIPGSVRDVKSVSVHSTLNVNGKEGGIFDVEGGTLYFINSTAGRKRYYPYTQTQMEAGFVNHGIANYWDLFTGKFGQPGNPTFSEITVNTNEIVVDTYSANQNSQTSLYDSFKIVKGFQSGIMTTKNLQFIYPVPAKNMVTTSSTNIKEVLAIDISGRGVSLPFQNQTIDVSNLSDGMYIVQIITDSKIEKSRLIVNKN